MKATRPLCFGACSPPTNTWSWSWLQLDNDIISAGGGSNHINAVLPPCLVLLRHAMHMSDSLLPEERGLWGMRVILYGFLVEMAAFKLTISAKVLTILNKLLTTSSISFHLVQFLMWFFHRSHLLFSSSSFLNSKICLLHSEMEKKKKRKTTLTTENFRWPWRLGSWPAAVNVVFSCGGQRSRSRAVCAQASFSSRDKH